MIFVFLLMNKFGFVNMLIGVIIVFISFLFFIGVFIIMGFMKILLRELFEVVCMDGVLEWKIYLKIVF